MHAEFKITAIRFIFNFTVLQKIFAPYNSAYG